MLTITESDYLPFQQFPLAWRFIDSKYNQLTPAELSQIHPLSPAAAYAVHCSILSLIGNRKSPLPAGEFGVAVQYDTSGDLQDPRRWLKRHLHGRHAQVVVSWDTDNAVVTTLALFIKYWDSFCYPGSDDTTIIPIDLFWIVQYWHEEVLYFRTRH